jgi:hypothetical protein
MEQRLQKDPWSACVSKLKRSIVALCGVTLLPLLLLLLLLLPPPAAVRAGGERGRGGEGWAGLPLFFRTGGRSSPCG